MLYLETVIRLPTQHLNKQGTELDYDCCSFVLDLIVNIVITIFSSAAAATAAVVVVVVSKTQY